MNINSVQNIAELIFNIVKGGSLTSFAKRGRQRDVLSVPLSDDVSIILIFNEKIHSWVLIAERETANLSECKKDQLLEALIDTTSHSRYDEAIAVGVTSERKITVSKILVDVSVKQDIINSIERIASVIMQAKYENDVNKAKIIA